MEKDEFLEVGKVDEIPLGKMKHVEVQGKEIAISNVGGKFYAMDDRCGHMNARLSMGNISNDSIVTCPFHGARFDDTTGKKIKEPDSNTFSTDGTSTKIMAKLSGTRRRTNVLH